MCLLCFEGLGAAPSHPPMTSGASSTLDAVSERATLRCSVSLGEADCVSTLTDTVDSAFPHEEHGLSVSAVSLQEFQ